MTNKEWLNEKKKMCENSIENAYDRIKQLERDLEMITNLISLTEGQPTDDRAAR